jgi:hypothetical protein
LVETVKNWRFGDMNHQAIKAMAIGSNGTVVIGGDFGGTLTFGSAMSLNNGTQDLWPYVARIGFDGNGVAVYSGTAKGVTTGVAVKEPDIFAVKLTFGSGAPTIKTTHIEKSGGWSKMLGGDAENGAPSITGGGGWLHMAASVKGMVDTFACPMLPSFTTSTVDSLVMQIDPADGDCLWGTRIVESNVASVAASPNIVAIGGSYTGNIDLPGAKPPNTGTAAFLAVYDLKNLHNLIGTDFLATETSVSGIIGFTTVSIGSSGDIFAAGTFKGALIAKGETLKSTNEGADFDLIVAKYTSTANLLWIKRFGGMGLQIPNSIVASGNNVFISGTTPSLMAIAHNTDSGPLCATGKCMFLLDLDATTGATRWGRAFGSGETADDATALITADTGNLWLGGGWSTPIDFGSGNQVPSPMAQDAVLAWFTALP